MMLPPYLSQESENASLHPKLWVLAPGPFQNSHPPRLVWLTTFWHSRCLLACVLDCPLACLLACHRLPGISLSSAVTTGSQDAKA